MKLQGLIFVIFFLSFVTAKAQAPLSSVEVDRLLEKAEKATRQYTETFKNLSADETKTFEDYEKDGKLKETRLIKSNFIVYQSANGDGVNEFRNVKEFNGQAIVQSEDEIRHQFDRLAKAGSNTDEGKMLKKEALRFDGKSSAWGMTLWQESPFGNLRPFFEFTFAGRERIEGRNVIVLAYRQTKPTLLLKFNPTEKDWKKEPSGREYHASIPAAFRVPNAQQMGKIWLDAETGKIWRNELKITIQPSQLSKPVVALELNYEYQPSEFKILVPKRFSYIFYKISGSGDKNLSVTKDRTMLFEYSKFSQFKTEMKDFKTADKNENK